jgi:hypothetical protein
MIDQKEPKSPHTSADERQTNKSSNILVEHQWTYNHHYNETMSGDSPDLKDLEPIADWRMDKRQHEVRTSNLFHPICVSCYDR